VGSGSNGARIINASHFETSFCTEVLNTNSPKKKKKKLYFCMRAAAPVCMQKYTVHVSYQNIRWDKDSMKVA
jgi:hypothetical protein